MEYQEQQKLRDMDLHAKLLEVGREIETTQAHQLEVEMIEGIIATFDYYQVSNARIYQMAVDLIPDGEAYVSTMRSMKFEPHMTPMYKIFDWLGFMYDGACVIGEDDDELVFKIISRMVEHYIAMKNVGGWAWSYRGHIDLESELKNPVINGKKCQDCIDSYESWHKQTPKEREDEAKEREKLFGGAIQL